jgi:Zn-dependent peptidase ImmA (M78 family)
MMASKRISVAPEVLEWARRTSGLDASTACKRIQVGEERILAWEMGTSQPTINQLRKMAKTYRRPLAVLLLPAPPKDFEALRDFRRTGDGGSRAWSPALHIEFKRALTQHEVILELAEIAPSSLHAGETRFKLPRQASEEAGQELRTLLGMDRWKSTVWSDPRSALRTAIEAVEALGVLILQTRDVAISEMRGFSLSEWPYPVIVINGGDWPRPKLFTLLHELCHLAFNSGGLCDLHESHTKKPRDEDRLEHYCNEVAAIALMPRSKMLDDPDVQRGGSQHEWPLEELHRLSERYGASSEAVLLRLVGLQVATWDVYWRRKPELEQAYEDARQQQKDRQRKSKGGPSYFTVKARNLGHGYVNSVLDAFHAHAISSLDVADYLDIRFDQVPKIEQAVLR